MNLEQAIIERRSIRNFKDKEIPREVLERVIKKAMWAPSAMNTQPWKFYVLSKDKKDEMTSILSEAINNLEGRLKGLFKDKMVDIVKQYFMNFGNAPHYVIVTTDKLDNEVYQIGAYESAAAAVHNFCLLAHEEGLGTCWMTGILFVEQEVLRFLNANDKKLVAVIPVGYGQQEPPVPPRKDEEIIWLG